MNQQDIEYALAKQVPDMARGFTISTRYGDIIIEAGWVARMVIARLERALRSELLDLEVTPQASHDRQGFSSDTALIGGDYEHSAVPLSGLDAQALSAVLVSQHAQFVERLQAVHDLLASLRQTVCLPSSTGLSPTCQAAPDPALPGGAPAAHTHCAAPSASCAGLAPQPSVAPAPATPFPDLSFFAPEVD